MYAFRKPFTAGTFDGQEIAGLGMKTTLVVAQLLGYMTSKFIGIKVVSEMSPRYRVASIIGLIGIAEIALVGFAFVPPILKPLMMFLNGLPLGMIFGLVLGYLEGRKQTEALSAALCASFIVSSGVVKSVGRSLTQDWGVSEFHMPMYVGLLFLIPLLITVAVLHLTPPPDQSDRDQRRDRTAMTRKDRLAFLSRYWPGLLLLVLVYAALTIVRAVRDDFAVEIWRDLGVAESPSIYARSELIVAIVITAFSGLTIWLSDHLVAMRVTMLAMGASFGLVAFSAVGHWYDWFSPLGFMVACGVGLYVPYVAFHTTVFERLVAASRMPGNLGFLMYVADASGYLGYALVLVVRVSINEPGQVLPFFSGLLIVVAIGSAIALATAFRYFSKQLRMPAP